MSTTMQHPFAIECPAEDVTAEDYPYTSHLDHWLFAFSNGHGASIIRGPHSYGGPELWELAVLDSNGHLDYSTPITDDVIGHLTTNDVSDLLHQIARLP